MEPCTVNNFYLRLRFAHQCEISSSGACQPPCPVKPGHACIYMEARPGTNLTTSLTSIKERTQRARYIHTHSICIHTYSSFLGPGPHWQLNNGAAINPERTAGGRHSERSRARYITCTCRQQGRSSVVRNRPTDAAAS